MFHWSVEKRSIKRSRSTWFPGCLGCSQRDFGRYVSGVVASAFALLTMCSPRAVDAQTIPTPPTNLTASVVAPAFQIRLSWTDTSTNEDGFTVERSLDGTNFTQIAQVLPGTSSFRNTALFPNTTYYYRVRAYNAGGTSAYSSVASAGTPALPCPTSIVGWGYNGEGELTPPSGQTDVVAIAAGGYHSLALKSDGTVIGWGADWYGQATPPAGLTGVVAVAAGYYHSLALKSDGTVVAWGGNWDWNGNYQGQAVPPAGLTGVVAIAAGWIHSLALKSDGTVVGWGDNYDYNNTYEGQATPPAGLTGVVAIAAGGWHSLALKSDGTIVGWGSSGSGQLSIPTFTNFVAIAAGGYDGLALQSDSTVVGWGYNGAPPAGLAGGSAIAAGYAHALVLSTGGTVIGWGNNDDGEATPPAGLGGAMAVSAGIMHSLALAAGPAPPSALTAIAVAPNEIDLSWSENSSGVEGFEIGRAADAGGTPGLWTNIATVGADVTTYQDTGVVTTTRYWYRMRAYAACNQSAYSAVNIPVILLDDTWTSGIRTNQNLPTSSAWWASTGDNLTAAPGSMTLTVGGDSVLGITYFTPDVDSPPVQLNVGDTLTATITFMFNGVPPVGSSSQGFRIGLFDFADSTLYPRRVTADGFSATSQGDNVQGYALFEKMYGTFNDDQPMDIRKRTVIGEVSLLGTSSYWTSLKKDHLDTGSFPGFANLTPYSLQFVLQRTGLNSLVITMTWLNMDDGTTLAESITDNLASDFNFDGLAFRPQNVGQAPATNQFTEATVELASAPIAPLIVTQPQDQSVSSGQNATFTVVPNGTLPLIYQWYYNTNTPVVDATNSTLTITDAQPTDAGGYSLVVSNSYGSVTSALAQLMVTVVPPSIITQPQDLALIPGQSAVFSVVAIGNEPLIYQWYYNTNTPVANATDSTLTLADVQPGDAGSYSVLVSNSLGTVISSNAVLNVNTNPVAPVFTLQPASLSVTAGDGASFAAAAVGPQPITYQWYRDGTPIPGATSTTLNLISVQQADAGNYTVIASNSIGSTTSAVAVLTVTVRLTPPLPVIPTNQFNILDYGATGDGVTDNAIAIQNTIYAAAAAGGGTVVVPAAGMGSTYLSGPITLASGVNLQINSGAMLQMLPMSNWPNASTPFITGSSLHDVEISGLGIIDGQGTNWWFPKASNRPDFIHVSGSTRVLIQDVTLQNPPTFHMMLKGNNVSLTIQHITINTPGDSPNTDGMDLASTNVLVQNCVISDGDDNIEIGGSGVAADITVSNCTFGTGHGVSIGSTTSGGVYDLLVSNCTFNGTHYGIRMKSDNDRGGVVQGLRYLDMGMTNVDYPIVIYSYYSEFGTPNVITPQIAAAQPPTLAAATTPIWRNILIRNLTATATTGTNISGIIWGRPEHARLQRHAGQREHLGPGQHLRHLSRPGHPDHRLTTHCTQDDHQHPDPLQLPSHRHQQHGWHQSGDGGRMGNAPDQYRAGLLQRAGRHHRYQRARLRLHHAGRQHTDVPPRLGEFLQQSQRHLRQHAGLHQRQQYVQRRAAGARSVNGDPRQWQWPAL
jgi:hypothetical protein